MIELKEYQRSEKPNWCLGCGNFGIVRAVKKSLAELGIEPHQTVLATGVGCYAKLPYCVKANGFVGLHGRELAVAQGVKLANPNLQVIALSGDGAGYGECGNHFLHACRRNIKVTYLVHNNEVFGLTTGQYSPTSRWGKKTKASPEGAPWLPLNPLALAISAGATFVARAYAGHIKETVEIIKQAIQHPGFAFVDILQPCLSFNPEHNHEYYQNKVYYLDEKNHNSGNKVLAFEKALGEENQIACGVVYRKG